MDEKRLLNGDPGASRRRCRDESPGDVALIFPTFRWILNAGTDEAMYVAPEAVGLSSLRRRRTASALPQGHWHTARGSAVI